MPKEDLIGLCQIDLCEKWPLKWLFVTLCVVLWFNIGVRSWLCWRRELDVAADLLYFSLTTFGGLSDQCLASILY